jgi:hypothetical protein
MLLFQRKEFKDRQKQLEIADRLKRNFKNEKVLSLPLPLPLLLSLPLPLPLPLPLLLPLPLPLLLLLSLSTLSWLSLVFVLAFLLDHQNKTTRTPNCI